MSPVDVFLDLDGSAWELRFGGFDAPLRVTTDQGMAWVEPWRLGDHLAALSTLVVPPGRLDLDPYADRVLARVARPLRAQLRPVARWWAAGGDAPTPPLSPDGRWEIEGYTLHLRPWTFGQRLAALAEALGPAEESLDVGLYTRRLLEDIVTIVDGPPLLSLPSSVFPRLIDLATRTEGWAPAEALREALSRPWAAAATVQLCRTLGWRPAEVLAAPSAEISPLLSPPARSAAPAAPAALSHRSRIAHHPDAIVIRVEED